MNQVTRTLSTFLLLTLFALFPSCRLENSSSNVSIPGVIGPNVVIDQDNILISMIFQNIALDGGLRYQVPKTKYSYMEISPDLQSGGTLMSFSLSLQDILKGGLTNLDPQKLPGGRALPGVASGALPAVAFSIEKFKNVVFYVGPTVFGVFAPSKINAPGILTFRYNMNGKRAGNISIVGVDQNGENSGVLLLLDLTGSTKKSLDRLANIYSR